ncbi:MAG: Ig-like domain-containing protein [Micromonosporaceae bacterium]
MVEEKYGDIMVAKITRASHWGGFGAVATALLVAVTLAGCGGPTATWSDRDDPKAAGAGTEQPISLAITAPTAKATDVPTSAEIGLRLSGADKTEVVLTAEDGTTITGELRQDGSSWVPGQQLAYGTTYTVKATASNAAGTVTKTSTFTTMRQTGRIMGAGLYLFDGQTVGVGMPVVVEFTRPVTDRAAVEKRLFVTSEPAVEGSWHWFGDSQVHYRPKDYWAPGTKLSVRIAIGGLPFGDGWYGKRDRVAKDITVGEDVRLEVDNTTKKLTVYKGGQVVKTIPVSLGKASSPSSSGNLVIMEKQAEAWFDSSTYGVPVDSADGYRTKVYHTLRLTWGGEFIHGAPWSVGDQGRRNVSHGCVNVSSANARYLFELTKIGDPVTVKNTEAHVGKGDGWTGWDMSWEDYQKGSALS